jgi:predicted ATPase
MLRKFTVNNFKSLINVTYEPGVVNLLIGTNNSGKTNLCQAIRFLSGTAREQDVIGKIWLEMVGATMAAAPMKNVYFDHPTMDFGCNCELNINGETFSFRYLLSLGTVRVGPLSVASEQLQISGGTFGAGGVTLLENNEGDKIRLLNEEKFRKSATLDDCYQDITIPYSPATMLARLHDSRANELAIAFRDYLSSWQYYELDDKSLRGARFDQQADILNSDGSNLASALFRLKNSDERRYRRLIELTRTVEQRLDALNFNTTKEHIEMELTDSHDHRFGPRSASGGTLRFMALCYIMMMAKARQKNPPLTIIEEPENGIYARHLKPLFELVDPSGAGGQYIFTSHAPYFIDLFENHLDNITLMQDRGTYSALSKPDPAQIRKYLEEMPLGELHFREMLA